MVDALYRDFPLKTLLSAMGIKRSSYYHRQSRHRQAHDLLIFCLPLSFLVFATTPRIEKVASR